MTLSKRTTQLQLKNKLKFLRSPIWEVFFYFVSLFANVFSYFITLAKACINAVYC